MNDQTSHNTDKNLTTKNLRIALIGCGKMGGAMLRGWLAAKIIEKVYILDPGGLPDEFVDYTPNPLTYYDDATRFVTDSPSADIFMLAVKPQIMDEVCRTIAPAIPKDKLILSIAAGRDIAGFEKLFSADQPIIRVMPNTPSAIGRGVSVAVPNEHVADAQKQTATTMLSTISHVEWLDDEELLDAVTAVSGSGPAYVFHLIEVMAAAGEKSGLPADLAMTLARKTVIGSAALAEKDTGSSAATLRENVTSPGGTTAAALSVLRDSGAMQDLFDKAIAAATKRGKELSGH